MIPFTSEQLIFSIFTKLNQKKLLIKWPKVKLVPWDVQKARSIVCHKFFEILFSFIKQARIRNSKLEDEKNLKKRAKKLKFKDHCSYQAFYSPIFMIKIIVCKVLNCHRRVFNCFLTDADVYLICVGKGDGRETSFFHVARWACVTII